MRPLARVRSLGRAEVPPFRTWVFLFALLLVLVGSAYRTRPRPALAAPEPRAPRSLQWVCDQLPGGGPVTEIYTLQPRYDHRQGTCGDWVVATFTTRANRDDYMQAVRDALGPASTIRSGTGWAAATVTY